MIKKVSSLHIEILIHGAFWILFFASINIQWTQPWFEVSLRPNNPAPLSALLFPIYFYIHAFWLMPEYFNKQNWWKYLLLTFLVFISPELFRAGFYTAKYNTLSISNVLQEITNRDSLIFGSTSAAWFGYLLSFIYRTARDSIMNRRKIRELQFTKAQSELDQLKAQINPHFLFNSLNALDGLISDENINAKIFLSNLTKIHRFYLKNSGKDFISLNEEWNALEHYMHLLKVRFGGAYSFEYDMTTSEFSKYYIPPATLQFIVDNVVKHNIGVPESPLVTKILIQNNQIVFSNPIRPKKSNELNNDIGLNNIEKRITLLSGKKISVDIDDHYTIKVPLIKKEE